MRLSSDISRRGLLEAGLALGALALAGCQTQQVDTDSSRTTVRDTAAHPAAPVPAGSTSAGPYGDGALPPGVLARHLWTGHAVARPTEILPMNGVTRITVHHDGMDPFTSTSQGDAARRMEIIRASHVNGGNHNKPFADIGYHFAIDPGGRVWECRSVRYQGAHVKDNNEHNLGVVVLGNYDLQQPTPMARISVDHFVSTQMSRYHVPVNRVLTHQEINPTACPGSSMQRYMLLARARGGSLRLAAAAFDPLLG